MVFYCCFAAFFLLSSRGLTPGPRFGKSYYHLCALARIYLGSGVKHRNDKVFNFLELCTCAGQPKRARKSLYQKNYKICHPTACPPLGYSNQSSLGPGLSKTDSKFVPCGKNWWAGMVGGVIVLFACLGLKKRPKWGACFYSCLSGYLPSIKFCRTT